MGALLQLVNGDRHSTAAGCRQLVDKRSASHGNADAARRIISIQTMMIDDRTIGCAAVDSSPGRPLIAAPRQPSRCWGTRTKTLSARAAVRPQKLVDVVHSEDSPHTFGNTSLPQKHQLAAICAPADVSPKI
jgi:hypothetical protein